MKKSDFSTTDLLPKRKPLSLAVRHYCKQHLCAAGVLGSMVFNPIAHAESPEPIALEEVIVTAQKKAENMQDVPISLQALDATALEQNNIKSFDDYISVLPNVSYNARGPGQAMIYMRGISDGGDGNFSGAGSSAAIYLDETPATVIGRNLDVHIYDIERVEVLAGPQGTLFGGGAQGGVLRLITNKPKLDEFYSQVDASVESTKGGGLSNMLEGVVNIPVNEKAAIRLVGWLDNDAGYIDSVSGTKTIDKFGVTLSSDQYAKQDYNEATNSGARISLKYDINDDWTLNLSDMMQSLDKDGIWDHDPEEVGDLQVLRFGRDAGEDRWNLFSAEVEGQLGDYELVYTGSWLDRDVERDSDYTEYSEFSGWIDYYICEYDGDGNLDYTACGDPSMQFEEESEYSRLTQEIRLSYKGADNYQFIVGLFFEDAEHAYDLDWRLPGIKDGFAAPGADDGIDTYFTTDQVRKDSQSALFGEVTYDFNDQISATAGLRFFNYDSSIDGWVGTVYSGTPEVDVDTSDSSSIMKLNVTYHYDDDMMFYATWSEGYRPGGANRTFTANIPLEYEPDYLDNMEIGWKTELLDRRLRFNGAAYFMTWDQIQITRFDPSESFLALTANAGEAEVTGLELQLDYLINESWTISYNSAYTDAALSKDFVKRLANGTTPAQIIPSGTDLPFTPDFKYTVSTRYEFNVLDMDAYAQGRYSFTGGRYNDLVNPVLQESYDTVNVSFGMNHDNWSGELFIQNLTDERAEIFRNTVDVDELINTNRPRTLGMRFSLSFE